jgi:hypothetical protein
VLTRRLYWKKTQRTLSTIYARYIFDNSNNGLPRPNNLSNIRMTHTKSFRSLFFIITGQTAKFVKTEEAQEDKEEEEKEMEAD